MYPAYEAPEWYYSTTGMVTEGPVTTSHLHHLVQSGFVVASHFVRHEAWTTWYTVEQAATQIGLPAIGVGLAPVTPGLPPLPSAAPPAPSPVAAPLPNPAPAYTPAYNPADAPPPPQYPPPPGAVVVATPGVATVTAAVRVGSWAIDLAVLVVGVLIFSAVLPSVIAMLFSFVAYGVYLVVLPVKGLDTIGHLVTGIRVVRVEERGDVDWLTMGTRAAVVMLLAAPCLVGLVCSALSMAAHPQARAWHDTASGTTMTRRRPFSGGPVAGSSPSAGWPQP